MSQVPLQLKVLIWVLISYKEWMTWCKQWGKDTGIDAGPTKQDNFVATFLDRSFLLKVKEAKVLEFSNLKQGDMSVRENSLKFTQLLKCALSMIIDSNAQMSKFILGYFRGCCQRA